jgi:hypothetical protein
LDGPERRGVLLEFGVLDNEGWIKGADKLLCVVAAGRKT